MIDYTKLLDKLSPDPGGEGTVRLRVGTVDAINADGTLDIDLSGVIIPDIPKLVGAYAPVGAVVQMVTLRGSYLVLGAVALTDTDGLSNRIATTIRTSSTSAVSSETLADSVSADLVIGRTYRVTYQGGILGNTAGDSAFIRLRENNLAGTQLQLERVYNPATGGGGSRWTFRAEAEFTAVATGSKTFAATYARATGTGIVEVVASATQPVYLYVDYIRG